MPFGDERLDVVGLVGHTPGSIVLAYRGPEGPTHLFTGDSLFPGGPGKTWSPEDFDSLMDDLEAKVFNRFADDTVVHPGHGDAHDDRRRAAAPAGVARARLVTPAERRRSGGDRPGRTPR